MHCDTTKLSINGTHTNRVCDNVKQCNLKNGEASDDDDKDINWFTLMYAYGYYGIWCISLRKTI